MTPAELGSRLIALSETGQLTAGVGSAAVAEAVAKHTEKRLAEAIRHTAERLGFLHGLLSRCTDAKSRDWVEYRIARSWEDLDAFRKDFDANSRKRQATPRLAQTESVAG